MNPALKIGFALLSAAASAATVLSPRDGDFVSKAAVAGIKEVELGRLATVRSANPRVQQFAAAMVADHGKANDQLAALARDNDWTMPMQMDENGNRALKALQDKQGAEFDDAYLGAMSDDHDAAVALFGDEADHADNDVLRNFASTTLPTLKRHQAMVNELKARR